MGARKMEGRASLWQREHQQVVAVRAVLHTREQGVLVLSKVVPVVPHLRGRNTQLCPLHRNMACL